MDVFQWEAAAPSSVASINIHKYEMALEYYTEITWLTNAHHIQGVVAGGSVDTNQMFPQFQGVATFPWSSYRADSGRRHIMWLIAST